MFHPQISLMDYTFCQVHEKQNSAWTGFEPARLLAPLLQGESTFTLGIMIPTPLPELIYWLLTCISE